MEQGNAGAKEQLKRSAVLGEALIRGRIAGAADDYRILIVL